MMDIPSWGTQTGTLGGFGSAFWLTVGGELCELWFGEEHANMAAKNIGKRVMVTGKQRFEAGRCFPLEIGPIISFEVVAEGESDGLLKLRGTGVSDGRSSVEIVRAMRDEW